MLESHVSVASPAAIAELDETTVRSDTQRDRHHTSLRSIGIVVASTAVGAVAQILLRFGAENLNSTGLAGILTNWPLLGGYACLGVMTLLVVLALRGGQLSVLYPIIALTYVWVTILSPMFFVDAINAPKIIGLALIIVGVSFIGAGSRS
jgi:multidrug transporter EmrE-like cation transporter